LNNREYSRERVYLMTLKHRFSDQLSKLAWRFWGNSKGNVAVIFAIASIPMLVAIGCAVDYSLAARMKSKMQSAADAASVGAISQSSPGYAAAEAMTGNGSVAAGVTDSNNIFMSNLCGPIPTGCTNISGYSNLAVTPTVTKTGSALVSVVNFTAQVPVTFLKVMGWQTLTISGTSTSSAAMSTYLDFYLTLDVSGSMGLPSTAAEETRLSQVNPDNFVQYPTGCTLACHFAPQASACQDDTNVTPPNNYPLNPPTTTTAYTQQYSTSSYCMGYIYSRLSQSALTTMINAPSSATGTYGRKQVPGLPDAMLSNLNNSLSGPNSLIAGNSNSLSYSLTAATSCPTDGTDACIQLRLDAVGYAVTQLLSLASATEAQTNVTNQFRIGLYPFIEQLYDYFPLTTSINGSSTNSSTINYAAANLATLLDTNMNANLGSGGTHIDVALNSLNSAIVNVGNGSSSTNTQPFVFLVTDGAQDPQTKGVPNGGWSGTNHATVLNNASEVSYPNACQTLKNRGIIVGVLYIPYQPINPVNSAFASDEDDYANNNIPNIPPSLQACASPNYFFTASTPQAINTALQQMFQQSLITAHITN
jgi:Flp pilus assembly protein TadG